MNIVKYSFYCCLWIELIFYYKNKCKYYQEESDELSDSDSESDPAMSALISAIFCRSSAAVSWLASSFFGFFGSGGGGFVVSTFFNL